LASVTYVLFGTHRGPHIVRPSRPHKFLLNYVNTSDIVKQGDIKLRQKVETVHAFSCRLILFSYAFSGQQSDKIIRSYKLPILPTDKSLYEIQ